MKKTDETVTITWQQWCDIYDFAETMANYALLVNEDTIRSAKQRRLVSDLCKNADKFYFFAVDIDEKLCRD